MPLWVGVRGLSLAARRVVTVVENLDPRWNRAMLKGPSETVGLYYLTRNTYLPIPIPIAISTPFQAASRLWDEARL